MFVRFWSPQKCSKMEKKIENLRFKTIIPRVRETLPKVKIGGYTNDSG